MRTIAGAILMLAAAIYAQIGMTSFPYVVIHPREIVVVMVCGTLWVFHIIFGMMLIVNSPPKIVKESEDELDTDFVHDPEYDLEKDAHDPA